jgi:hypothetical protein
MNRCLAMKPLHEERIKDLADKVEGIALDVDKGEEEVNNLLRRELDEFVFLFRIKIMLVTLNLLHTQNAL